MFNNIIMKNITKYLTVNEGRDTENQKEFDRLRKEVDND